MHRRGLRHRSLGEWPHGSPPWAPLVQGRTIAIATACGLGPVVCWLLLSVFIHAAAPSVRAAPQSQSTVLQPVRELGGQIEAAALRGDLAFVVVGRRVQVHDVSTPQGSTLVGESDPVTLPVLEAELLGEHILLLTGAPGVNGALEVLNIASPANPIHVGRLVLPRSVRGLATHGGEAWLAAGTAGVLRVALDDFGSPHLDGTWQPDDPGGNRVRHVVDVVGLDRSLVAMVASAQRTSAPVDHANLMVALAHDAGQGIRQSSVYTLTATAFRWGGQGDTLAYSAVDHIRVLDYQDSSHPTIAAAPTKRATTMDGLLPAGQVLAVVYDHPLLVEGHDLARGGRRSGDARLTLEGERRPLLLAGDGQRILVADESSFVVVPMTPAPAVVRPIRIPSSTYQHMRPSSRGVWLIDDRWRLSLSDHEGTVLGVDLLKGEMLVDVAETGDDLVAIVPRLGARVLAETPGGRFTLGRQLPQFPADWLVIPLDGSWLWLRASPTHVMVTSIRLMALASRAAGGFEWGGHLDHGFASRARVLLEDDVIYVASTTLQRLRTTQEGMLRVEPAPGLRWPASAPPLSMTGAQGRFLVGDSGGLVTRVRWTEDDAQVLWSLDMPGPVQQLVQANGVGWALWSIPGPVPRGDGGASGPPIASGITAFRLAENNPETVGTIVLAADAIDLYAHDDGLWVLGEDGAVSSYDRPQPRSPLAPAATPSATPMPTATATAAAPTPTPTATPPWGDRLWLPWARME